MTCFRLKSGQPMSSHCKLKGIDYRIAYNRVNKGYSVDEAVEYAKQIQGRGASLNNCIHYLSDGQSLRSKCFENGVPHGACYSLINKNGLSPDEAYEVMYKNTEKLRQRKEELRRQKLPDNLTQKDLEVYIFIKNQKEMMHLSEVSRKMGYRKCCRISDNVRKLARLDLLEVKSMYCKKQKRMFVRAK